MTKENKAHALYLCVVVVLACLIMTPWGRVQHAPHLHSVVPALSQKTMANPQITQGGSAKLTFSLVTSGSGGTYYIFNPAGTQVATAMLGTASNGYNTVGFDSSARTATVSVPASAPVGVGYYCTLTSPTGNGTFRAYFDVVAPSVTTLSPRTANNSPLAETATRGPQTSVRVSASPLLSETAQRGQQGAMRAVAAALLSTAALGTVSSPPHVSVLSVERVFTQSASRGPITRAPRVSANALLSETSPVRGTRLSDTAVTEPALLTTNAAKSAARLMPRGAANNLLLTEGGRGGRVSPAGTNPVPIVINERPLLNTSAVRSATSAAARLASNVLFAQSVQGGARGTVRKPVNVLLFQSARSLGVKPAPVPGVLDPRDPFLVFRAELLYLASLKEGSPVTFATTLLAILDNLAASYRTNDLNLSANTVAGLPVLIRGGDGTPGNMTYGFGQDAPILSLLPAAEQLITSLVPAKILDSLYRPIFTKMEGVLVGMGYANLNVFLSAMNAGSPGTYLVHPNAALLYYLFKNQQGNLLLSPSNVFAPQTAFGQGVVGSGGAVIYTDLSAIPGVSSTSPTPGLSTQGYTGSKAISLLVTTAVNGTLSVTVKDQAGVTWQAALDNKAAGQAVLMTPGNAGARVLDVVSLAGSGSASAGAFQVNSVLERVVG